MRYAWWRLDGWTLLSGGIILACFAALGMIGSAAEARRRLPAPNVQAVIHVARQEEVYRAYRNAGLRGVHVMQFGPHFHLEPFFPQKKMFSAPFPLETFDVRFLYEKGVDARTWLFIANRNGLVRRITSVLPDRTFGDKVPALESDVLFRKYGPGYGGYAYDLPRRIFPFSDYRCPDEPVVVNVDAGIFTGGIGPHDLLASLQQRCSDTRVFVLVESEDDAAVTSGMRRDLGLFREMLEHRRL